MSEFIVTVEKVVAMFDNTKDNMHAIFNNTRDIEECDSGTQTDDLPVDRASVSSWLSLLGGFLSEGEHFFVIWWLACLIALLIVLLLITRVSRLVKRNMRDLTRLYRLERRAMEMLTLRRRAEEWAHQHHSKTSLFRWGRRPRWKDRVTTTRGRR